MMKENLQRVLIKVSYILFALFISIALWLFVEIYVKEVHTREVTIDEIIYLNSELLSSRRLLVSSVITDELTLTFEGPLAEINKLNSGTVSVTVDLENVRSTGTFALNYTVNMPDGISLNTVRRIGSSDSQVILTIDRLLSKDIPVEVNYTGGTASDEYVTGRPVSEPGRITVTGPEEIISQIAHVYVPIAAADLYSTYTDELGFILVDENSEELSRDYRESGVITFDYETVRVTIPISLMKEVPLDVEFSHGATTSDSNITYHIEPATITVSGDPDVLKDLNTIMLGTIDMTGFQLKDSTEFTIRLPNDEIINETGITRATVMTEIVQQSLEIDLRAVSNLSIINTPPGYNAARITESTVVTLRGTATNLALVRDENIWIVADLTGARPGATRFDARATIVGTNAIVDIIGEYTMAVNVSEE